MWKNRQRAASRASAARSLSKRISAVTNTVHTTSQRVFAHFSSAHSISEGTFVSDLKSASSISALPRLQIEIDLSCLVAAYTCSRQMKIMEERAIQERSEQHSGTVVELGYCQDLASDSNTATSTRRFSSYPGNDMSISQHNFAYACRQLHDRWHQSARSGWQSIQILDSVSGVMETRSSATDIEIRSIQSGCESHVRHKQGMQRM